MQFKSRTETNKIVIHCSATPAGRDIGAKDIDEWHRKKSWLAIGYHFVIRRSGAIELGRPIDVVGAHVKGNNLDSIGICMVGGIDTVKNKTPVDNFNMAQRDSLRTLYDLLACKYPEAEPFNHYALDSHRACPSWDAAGWLLKHHK